MGMVTNMRHWLVEKLNPAQERIAQGEGSNLGSEAKLITYRQAFKN